MVRRLLTPWWIALHLFAVVSVVALVGLGWWQWSRGVALDRVQNYAYGIEWWLFAAFAVFLWVKTAVDALEDPAEDQDAAAEPEPAPALPVAQQVDDDDDPELAAYNRHLAALHARAQQER